MIKKSLPTLAGALGAAFLICLALPSSSLAQVAPGPYEFLPFDDGFIFEAFFDLEEHPTDNKRADWSGWSGTSWVSPNAYNNHTGTDIALQTGTTLYALAAGEVVEIEDSITPNTFGNGGHGNYVMIRLDEMTPNGESLDVVYAHLYSVSVTVGQRVAVGDPVGISDNTGNSTSEHLHIQSEVDGGNPQCPLYWGHFKYPIVFSVSGTTQLGHVVRVTAESTEIRTDRFDAMPSVGMVHRGQTYFASYAKRGYYQIFIPGDSTRRSGWIRADHVEEVYSGTVIQTLPDSVEYSHGTPLQSTYAIRSAPDDSASQVGEIFFGGGRFVAKESSNGYYRISVPGETPVEGWVKADDRMIVYPELYNPAIDLQAIPDRHFPIVESFSETGKSFFGRAKFTRAEVREFSPASPNGDGKALFITDSNNFGNGLTESVLVGHPSHRNYYVQCDVYFNYQPAYLGTSGWERYGIFIRDDGFAGMSHSFEGGGNGYCLVWDSDDGRLRAGRFQDALVSNFMSPDLFIKESGWHTLRIEVRENNIKYLIDGELLIEVEDTTFPAGQTGIGYYWNPGGYPAGRGAYFDNFVADTLDPVALQIKNLSVEEGTVRFQIQNDVGATTLIERADTLQGPGNWEVVEEVPNVHSVVEFEDAGADAPMRFYRAREQLDQQ